MQLNRLSHATTVEHVRGEVLKLAEAESGEFLGLGTIGQVARASSEKLIEIHQRERSKYLTGAVKTAFKQAVHNFAASLAVSMAQDDTTKSVSQIAEEAIERARENSVGDEELFSLFTSTMVPAFFVACETAIQERRVELQLLVGYLMIRRSVEEWIMELRDDPERLLLADRDSTARYILRAMIAERLHAYPICLACPTHEEVEKSEKTLIGFLRSATENHVIYSLPVGGEDVAEFCWAEPFARLKEEKGLLPEVNGTIAVVLKILGENEERKRKGAEI